MTPTPPAEDDYLDGMCSGVHIEHPTTDEEAPYVALFCDDLDPDEHVLDQGRLVEEAHAWHQLFDKAADRSGGEGATSPDPGGQPGGG